MKKFSAADEIAFNMSEELKGEPELTLADKAKMALDHLSSAAGLFDSIEQTKYAEAITDIVVKIASELSR